MENLTTEQWKKQLNEDANAVVIDVRTPSECAQGIQPNAKQLNIFDGESFMANLDQLDKTKSYYVYCQSGNRSGQACQIMHSKGLNSYNLLGGMMSWDGEVVR